MPLLHILWYAFVGLLLFKDLIDIFKAIAPTLLVGRVSAHTNTISRRQKMVVR